MNADYLEKKWASINQEGISVFRILRISPESKVELNIGFNNTNSRCLVLELPLKNNVDFQDSVKQNLTIQFIKDLNYIVIQLTDNTYHDLFNDLIISLYQRIKELSDIEICAKELIGTFYKWSEFFDDKQSDLLSNDIVKGLIGELIILRNLVAGSNSGKINDVLNSWQGPYDKGHDFILDSKNLEIKTKDFAKLDVRISSEYQLEPEFEKELELIVVSVEFDAENGLCLKDLIFSIKSLVIEKLGDSSILLRALGQKGITLKNIDSYNNLKFRPVSEITYNCMDDDFPKLNVSSISPEINHLNYNIRINGLDSFIINTKVH